MATAGDGRGDIKAQVSALGHKIEARKHEQNCCLADLDDDVW